MKITTKIKKKQKQTKKRYKIQWATYVSIDYDSYLDCCIISW